jgi:acyl transferase domain-containing protein
MDPQIRMFLKHAYIALEHAGYVKERGNLKVGCFVGAEPSSYGLCRSEVFAHLLGTPPLLCNSSQI